MSNEHEALKPLIIAFNDRIDAPWTGAGYPEPMEVRDYRHSIYRDWEPLCRAIMALATPEAPMTDTLERREAMPEEWRFWLKDAAKILRSNGTTDHADKLDEMFAALTTSPRVDEGRAREAIAWLSARKGEAAARGDHQTQRVCKTALAALAITPADLRVGEMEAELDAAKKALKRIARADGFGGGNAEVEMSDFARSTLSQIEGSGM